MLDTEVVPPPADLFPKSKNRSIPPFIFSSFHELQLVQINTVSRMTNPNWMVAFFDIGRNKENPSTSKGFSGVKYGIELGVVVFFFVF